MGCALGGAKGAMWVQWGKILAVLFNSAIAAMGWVAECYQISAIWYLGGPCSRGVIGGVINPAHGMVIVCGLRVICF